MKRIYILFLSLLIPAGFFPAALPGQPVPSPTPVGPLRFYFEPLDSSPGWTTASDWAFGPPAGQGGCHTPPNGCVDTWGYPDPSAGYTGNNVYGYNLLGDYPHNMPQTYYLTAAPVDCRGFWSVSLKFRRWLNVERSNRDRANLLISSDGVTWRQVWSNPLGGPTTDSEWVLVEYTVSSVADNQAALRLRWGMGPTDSQYTCSGWNIDDIELWGIPIPPPTLTPVPTVSPVPTATPPPTATPTLTPVPTATPTLTPVPTATPPPTATPTLTPIPTATPPPPVTPTPSVTSTPVPTATPLPTPSPGEPVRIYRFPLDTDPGWTAESAWAFGRPRGGGEEGPYYPNPTYARSGYNVYGFNLAGGYGARMPPYALTTSPIDCSELVKTRLVFYRWLNVERRERDRAAVEVSAGGGNWTTVWENPTGDWVRDSSWTRRECDISAVADRQGAVYLRWVMGPTDEFVDASGWNIDDIEIWAVPPGPTPVRSSTPFPTPGFPFPLLDYNGDGTSDLAIFRPLSGLWAVRGVTRVYFGAPTDLPVPGDYTGDGIAEVGVFRKSSGLWAIRGATRVYFGGPGDQPRPAEWSGAGKIGIGVFRGSSGLWAVRGLTRFYFGSGGDQPVEGYYGGLPAVAAVFRPAAGLWAVRGLTRFYFGGPADLPVPGDYDGLRRWRPAIFRAATGLWAIRGLTRFYLGSASDLPVPAEFSGRFRDYPAVFRPASGLWAVRKLTRIYFGAPRDLPVTR